MARRREEEPSPTSRDLVGEYYRLLLSTDEELAAEQSGPVDLPAQDRDRERDSQ